jgi:hypothetical protein
MAHTAFDFSEDKLQDSVGIKPPKADRLNQVPSWEFRNRRKSFTPRQLARILWDFAYLCWANTYEVASENSIRSLGMIADDDRRPVQRGNFVRIVLAGLIRAKRLQLMPLPAA